MLTKAQAQQDRMVREMMKESVKGVPFSVFYEALGDALSLSNFDGDQLIRLGDTISRIGWEKSRGT